MCDASTYQKQDADTYLKQGKRIYLLSWKGQYHATIHRLFRKDGDSAALTSPPTAVYRAYRSEPACAFNYLRHPGRAAAHRAYCAGVARLPLV